MYRKAMGHVVTHLTCNGVAWKKKNINYLTSPSDLGLRSRVLLKIAFFLDSLPDDSSEYLLCAVYLLLLVDLVPLVFRGGDFLGNDGGLRSIGLAGGDTFATNSFNLFDCELGLLTLGITNLSVAPFDVDGWTSGV